MTSPHVARSWLVAVAVCGGLLSPNNSSGQIVPVRRETVAVESSPVATRQVQTVLELAEAGQWDRALDVLQELESREPLALAEVESRHVLRGALAAQVLRSQFPDNVLASYRNRVDLVARELITQGTLAEDVTPLRQVLERYSASHISGEAVARLAELLWRDGDIDHAAALWNLLTDSPAPPVVDATAPLRVASIDLNAADLTARLALASLVEHDWVQADAMLARLQQEFPNARGVLGGREGLLSDILRDLGATETRVQGRMSADKLSDLALSDTDRCLLWISTLPEEQAPSLTSRLLISNQELSEIAPAALGKAIFWSEPGGIRAVRYDGAPLWPSGEYLNDDLVYESGGDLTSVPEFPLLGHGLRQISVDNGRLIALLGSQIAIEARREPRSLESRLVCLDIADGEGKLLWSHSPSEALPSAEWRFSGPPVMRHDRVYVPVRRARPINAVGVVCLDAHNGDKLWFEQVAGLLSEPPETYHVVCADGLTIAYERVFLGGDFGALACLDVRTGRIEWVRRDEPVPWRVPPRVPEAESAGRRPLCYRGRTFTIEQDDSTVMSVDAWTGAMLWRRTLPAKLTTLVDARHGFLYAVGDHLWALDLETGAVLWRFGLDDVEGEFLGQAVLVGSTAAAVDTSASLLACTHDELWQINALSGAPERRIPLRELYNLAGGRLIPLSNRLLLVTPHQLAMLEWVGLSALPPIH